jgi:RecA-family ATPase/DNA polymerase I-like protein with 3'-5' exonuclease and polymerase domains
MLRPHRVFCRLASRYIIAAPAADETPRLRLGFDVETDGLRDSATKIHCIVIADLDGDQIDAFGPDQINAALARLSEADYLIGHNVCGFDLAVLQRLYGWAPKPDCRVVDTLIASRLILANLDDLDDEAAAMGDPKMGKLRGRHSLEAWGVRFGAAKVGVEIEDFACWTPELQERCVGDVNLTKTLWRFLQPDGQPPAVLALEHRIAAICHEVTAAGIPFERAAAERRKQQWTGQRAALETRLREQFPEVSNLNSRQQLARLLEARGWVPAERTEKTKQPKLDDEALEGIGKQFPEFAGLSEYFVLGRRLGQLAHGKKAWLKHVDEDGRIRGGLVHIGTPHHRAKHLDPNLAQVPNPKRGKPFAAECRALFRCDADFVFVTVDQSGLQDRAFAHLLSEFDGGVYARAYLAGLDPHWAAVQALGLVPPGTARDKENKFFAALREGIKAFRYAFLFGAQGKRLGIILYNSIKIATPADPLAGDALMQRFFPNANDATLRHVGKEALARFEAATPGLGALRQALERHARRGWLPGLDGRRIPVRALYTALNYAVTAIEAVICKRWLDQVHAELHARFRYGWDGDVVIVAWTHDELAACCRPRLANQVGEILKHHAVAAGEHFALKLPLVAELAIGRSWGGDDLGEAENAEPQDVCAMQVNVSEIITDPREDLLDWVPPGSDLDPSRGGLCGAIVCAAPGEIEQSPNDPPWEQGKTKPPLEEVLIPETNPSPGDAPRIKLQPTTTVPGQPHDEGSGYRGREPSLAKPYARTCAWLQQQGYGLARRFKYVLPGGRVLYCEDRFELRPGIVPSREHPRKTCRFWHAVNGTAFNNTGPREERIVYNWPAILEAGPGATVHVTEGAIKADALAAKGLLATAVAYHNWNDRSINALRGLHLIYHEDHDLPDKHSVRPGEKFSADARAKLTPVAASFRILPARRLWENLQHDGEPPPGWDIRDWLEAGGDVATLEAICREVAATISRINFIDMSHWDDEAIPEQEWAVYNRIPLRQVTLFSGEGGAGKSIMQLHLSVAQVLGRDWLGVIPEQGPAIFVDAEDDEKVLHKRLKAVGAHYGASIREMISYGLHLVSWVGCDATLALAKQGKIEPTPLYHQLLETAGDIKPKMLGIAASANVFGGNENDRGQVQQFVGLLTRIAIVANSAVVLISHPSLTGITTDTGLSGTTQWHNSARARFFMHGVRPDDGEPVDTDLREITFKKNNYGSISESIVLRWTDGLYLPVAGISLDVLEREALGREVFLNLLRRFLSENRNVSYRPSPTYAPAVFAREAEAEAAGLNGRNLAVAMRQLFAEGGIWNEPIGRPSRPSYRIAIK